MKSIKIIVVSVVCAMLALSAISLPAGVMSSAFAMGSAVTSPLPPPTGNTCLSRAVVYIRRGPSTRYRVVGRLPRNGTFIVTNRSGRWVQGTSRWGNGWVMASLLRCAK